MLTTEYRGASLHLKAIAFLFHKNAIAFLFLNKGLI